MTTTSNKCSVAPTPDARLFVGNLSWAIDSDQLKEIFEEVSTVVSARVFMKPDGSSRGFGFVKMSTSEGALAAIERFNGTDLGGRPVAVHFAKPREDDGWRRDFRPRDSAAPRYLHILESDQGEQTERGYRAWQEFIDLSIWDPARLASLDKDQLLEIMGELYLRQQWGKPVASQLPTFEAFASAWKAAEPPSGPIDAELHMIAKDPDYVLTLKSKQFEEVTTKALRLQGFKADCVGRPNDKGIDIVAHWEHPSVDISIGVQCKRNRADRQIGSADVRLFSADLIFTKLDAGLFVTTSTFSSDARRAAKESLKRIKLLDRYQYHEWVAQTLKSNEKL
jgi:hypothetical protein